MTRTRPYVVILSGRGQHAVRDVAAAVSDAAAYGVHAAVDVGGLVVSAGARVAHGVTRWAVHHYQAAVHLVRSAVHVVARAATATVAFVKHHAAAIASIVVSAAVFIGCDAALGVATGGVGAVAGAVACGELAGAAGSAVGYGITAAQTGKFSLSGLAQSVASGAITGAAGGFLGGAGAEVIGMAGRAVAGALLTDGAASAASHAAAAAAADGLTTTATQDATSTIAAKDGYIDLYHGTSSGAGGAANIRSNGIDLGVGKANRDFGRGFYMTRDPVQAAKWASQNFGDSGTVLRFRVPSSMFDGLSGKVFPDANSGYLDMVRSMRSGGTMHSFDYVEGPLLGNPDDFLAGKEPFTFGHQISFHSETAVNRLNGYLQ